MANLSQQSTPGADTRCGTVTYDPKLGEWVADHSSTANRLLRPFGRGGSR